MFMHVTHEIVLDDTSGEIKICSCCSHGSTKRTIASLKTHCVDCDECNIFSEPKVALQKDSSDDPPVLTTCHHKQKSLDTIGEHDVSEHSGKD